MVVAVSKSTEMYMELHTCKICGDAAVAEARFESTVRMVCKEHADNFKNNVNMFQDRAFAEIIWLREMW